MSIEDNKKLVTEFFDCFGKKEVDVAMNMMADDGTWWIGGDVKMLPIAGLKTKAAMREILEKFVPNTVDGLKIIPKLITAEGDRVAYEAISRADFPSGFVYENEYHFLVTVKNGKIFSVKEYLDPFQTAQMIDAVG